MLSEQELLQKLKSQIAKIEKLVLDLQQDFVWQRIFYRKKLYLNLKGVFKKNYIEYTKYLENIIKDYNVIISITDKDLKLFYIHQLEHKIFALFKVLRRLNKNIKHDETLHQLIKSKQQQTASLLQQQQTLFNMVEHLDKQYNLLNKKLLYGTTALTDLQKEDLKSKLINLLVKKGQIEQDLFSIKERINLLN